MKKIIAFIICLVLALSLIGCTSNNSNSLVKGLTGTNNLNSIVSFEIIHGYGDSVTKITEKSDLEFLKKYTYSHIYPTENLHELLVFPQNCIINYKVSGADESSMYLMQDGSLVKINKEVKDGADVSIFEVYTAEEKYMLNTEKLKTLLQKYGEKVD